ncbi:MAG: hypothetical protein M3R01_09290 [Actinomycetota bacterium]|nr:hypothetical protein [Actinomycetota bacterium]
MIGAVVMVVIIVVVVPVSILVAGAVASALLGWFLKDDADTRHADSELIDLNR